MKLEMNEAQLLNDVTKPARGHKHQPNTLREKKMEVPFPVLKFQEAKKLVFFCSTVTSGNP